MSFDTSFLIHLKDNISPKLRKISSNLKNAEAKVTKSTSKMSAGFKKFEKRVDLSGKAVKAFKVGAVAATAGASASVVAFASMEKGLVNVKTLLDKSDLDKFSQDLLKMQHSAVQAGFSILDVNKALFDNVSASGMSTSTISAFKEGQILAKAGVTDLGIAIDGITSLVNAYGKESTSAKFAANALFSAQKAGKTTVADLASNIGNVASNAKIAGISLEETLATISALTTSGISTSTAVTGLKGAIAALIKPSQESEKYFKSLGVPFGAASIKAEGFTNILKKLTEVSKIYGTDTLAKLIPAQEAFTAISALGDEQLKLLNNTVKNINTDFKNGTGMLDAYGMQIDTTADKWAKFIGATKSAAASIGETITAFLPLEKATKFMTQYSQFLRTRDKEKQAEKGLSFNEKKTMRHKALGFNSESFNDKMINLIKSSFNPVKNDMQNIVNKDINSNAVKNIFNGQLDVNFRNAPEGMSSIMTSNKNSGLDVGLNTIGGAL